MFHFWLLSIFRNLLYLHNWLISYICFILVVSLSFTIYIFITVYLQILLCRFQYSIELTMVYFQLLPVVFHSIVLLLYITWYTTMTFVLDDQLSLKKFWNKGYFFSHSFNILLFICTDPNFNSVLLAFLPQNFVWLFLQCKSAYNQFSQNWFCLSEINLYFAFILEECFYWIKNAGVTVFFLSSIFNMSLHCLLPYTVSDKTSVFLFLWLLFRIFSLLLLFSNV